jgi:hypothetical protein
MQSPDVFLFPLTGRLHFSAVEIKQEHLVVLVDLQVVSVQVSMEHTRLVKAMQFSAEVLPEFIVARPLLYTIRQ